MIMFRRNFKNNVKNEMMRDERFIESFEIMIEIIIDLNDKLYERALKKRYHNQRQKRDENYVSHQTYEKKFETSRNQKHSNETIFIEFDAMLFKKFKNKKQKQNKKNNDVQRM